MGFMQFCITFAVWFFLLLGLLGARQPRLVPKSSRFFDKLSSRG